MSPGSAGSFTGSAGSPDANGFLLARSICWISYSLRAANCMFCVREGVVSIQVFSACQSSVANGAPLGILLVVVATTSPGTCFHLYRLNPG